MESIRPTRLFALLALSLLASSLAHAQNASSTDQALNALLSASNAFIPESSSCRGQYGQRGRATVKDLLANRLAYFSSGDNVIRGNCALDRCELNISHASETNVSTTIIKFDLVQGQVKAFTLECIFKP